MNTKLQKMAHPEWVAPTDLDLDLLGELGFIDQSYGNDICPSFYNYEKRMALFVDYPPELSEWGDDSIRYKLIEIDRHSEYLRDLMQSNQFNEVLDFVR